jgi:hypothetical protein
VHAAVVARDFGLCNYCAMNGYEVHHRRSRRVADDHQHCLCNLLLMCRTCHAGAHVSDNARARLEGYIVTQWEKEPMWVPMITIVGGMPYWQMTTCDGRAPALCDREVVADGVGPPRVLEAVQGLYRAS